MSTCRTSAALRAALLILLLCSLFSTTEAQVVREFQTTLGSTGEERGEGGIIEAVDGSLIIVGHSDSYGPDNDVYVAKLDPCGALIWARTYDINVDDYGTKIRESGIDNTFVVIGSTEHADGNADAFLLKIDQTGNVVWCKTYGRTNAAPGEMTPHDIGTNLRINSPDGTIYAVGYTRGEGADNFDAWAWSVGAGGGLIWSNMYGGDLDDRFDGLDWALDGDLVLAGSTLSYTPPNNDGQIFTVRINPPNGTVDWAFHRGGPGDQRVRSVAVNAVGPDMYLVGRDGIYEYAERISWATGLTAAERVIHHTDPDLLSALTEVVISDRHPYAVGYWTQSDGTLDMHVVDFPAGTMIPGMSRVYGGSAGDAGWGITRVYDPMAVYDSIAMVGTSTSFNPGTDNDIYVVAAYRDGVSGCNEADQPLVSFDPMYVSTPIELEPVPFDQCEARVIAAEQHDYRILCEACREEGGGTRGGAGDHIDLSGSNRAGGVRSTVVAARDGNGLPIEP